MTSKQLAKKISDLFLEKKGMEIRIMELTGLTTMTDYFVICTAGSDTQVKALAEHVTKETDNLDERPWHNEGQTNFNWVLLDFVNVVAHIFLPETRKFYNLEGLWADAKITEVVDKPTPAPKIAKSKK